MPGTLAIHPGALGDVLLAVPALRALRRETSPLVLAGQSHIGALLGALGEVDASVRLEALRLHELFTDDPPGAPAVARLEPARIVSWFGSGDPRFADRLRALAPAVAVAPSVPTGGAVWRHLLASVGAVATDEIRGAATVPSALLARAGDALAHAGWDRRTPFLVVHPGASGPAKRWPAEAFAGALTPLAAAGGIDVVVHEGPMDAAPSRAVLQGLSALGAARVLHLENPSLPVLAGALAQAAAYVGNDSGVSHLAALVGVRSVVLFRAAMRRWTPWSPTAQAVIVDADGTPDQVDAVRRSLEGAIAGLPVSSS